MSARLSPESKRTRGTSRPDREPREATALHRFKVAPAAPDHLSDRAKAEWTVLARVTTELGVLTGGDLRSLELLSEALASEWELRARLRTEGLTITGANGTVKGHPAARMLETTRSSAMRMLEGFGLTPKARLAVDLRPADTFNRFAVNGQDRAEAYFTTKPWGKK